MAHHDIENIAELEGAKAESVASMRAIGERCLRAEKIAFTADLVHERKPKEYETQRVLLDMLRDYLEDTASMVLEIKNKRLAIDLAQMKLSEKRAKSKGAEG
jgi:hypothetical protein